MTAFEYMSKQLQKHCVNYDRESARKVPEKMLQDIVNKISYYGAAVTALQQVEKLVYCHECRYYRDDDMCPMLSLRQYTEDDDYCSMGAKM